MKKGIRKGPRRAARQKVKSEREFEPFGPDPLTESLRAMVRGVIETLVAEELEEALGAARYERMVQAEARAGYRHGTRERTVTTSLGTTAVTLPRARVFEADGDDSEWASKILPRYARRARAVDNALVHAYLAGTNTRRVKLALKPMLKDAPLSRSTVSRVVRVLRTSFDAWRTARLDDKHIAYLYMDAIMVKVRVDRRVQVMAMLVAMGVHESGEKELLGLRLMPSESAAAWQAMTQDLEARGLNEPVLCIVDGSPGLRRAIESTWPKAAVQRCLVHKLRNLEAHCPKRGTALDDLRADFHAIAQAESEKAARAAHARIVRTWRNRSEGVVASLLEAGDELFTFFSFPRSQWKALRTTNCIERLQGEFRRRIKTQASLPTESSVLSVFYGLYDSGQLRLRRIPGWPDITRVTSRLRPAA